MSKVKSFVVSALSFMLAIVFFAQRNIPFTIVSLVMGLVFWVIFWVKYDRDTRIKDQARRELAQAAQTPPPIAQASKGSYGVFLPPPLQDTGVEE